MFEMKQREGADIEVTLRFSLIGAVRVNWQGHEVLSGKRKATALLTYLSGNPGFLARRETLANLFWGEHSEQKARSSLRQCLTVIRKDLPGVEVNTLIIGSETVALVPESFQTDLTEILDQLSHGELPYTLETHGDFSNSIYSSLVGLSPEFDVWLRARSSQMEASLIGSLLQLLRDTMTSNSIRLRACKVISALDSLNEEAAREAMHVLVEMNEIGAALKVYSNLYEALDHELGMEPSQATMDMVVAIKTGDYNSTATNLPAQAAFDTAAREKMEHHTEVPRIAILPFVNLGPEETPRFFAQGILEDTVSQLVRLQELQVYSSNTTRNYKDVTASNGLGTMDLDADYVVIGSLRNTRSACRVTVQLVDTRSGLTEWAQTYSVGMDELFDMQSDIATNIAHQIAPAVSSSELRRIQGMLPSNLHAYHLTLQAREVSFTMNPSLFQKARSTLLMARNMDPNFAPTSMALADWHSLSICQGWVLDEIDNAAELRKSTEEAIRLSRQSGRAMSMYGHCQNILLGFVDEAAEHCIKACELSPNDAEALIWAVPTLAFIGKYSDAVRSAKHAISLTPHDPFMFRYQHFLSIAQFAAGNYEHAVRAGQQSYRLNPLYTSNLRMTAACLVETGELEEARQLARKCLDLDPTFSVEALRARQPFKADDISERYVARLYEIGLPA